MRARVWHYVGWVMIAVACADDPSEPAPPDGSTVGIGPQGGSVEHDGAQVVVPAGALDQEVTIGVAEVDTGFPDLPGEHGPVIALTPHGQEFSRAVEIAIPSLASISSPILLTAPPGGDWQSVDGATLEGDHMRALVEHFSFFVVVEDESEPGVGGAAGTAGNAGDAGSAGQSTTPQGGEGGSPSSGPGGAGGAGGTGDAPAPEGDLFAASGFSYATGHVVLTETHVYFSGYSLANGGGIRRRPLQGGGIEEVVSNVAPPYGPIWGFAVSGSEVYFSNEGVVFTVPTTGGSFEPFATSGFAYSDGDLKASSTHLYWPGRDNDVDVSVKEIDLSGGGCGQVSNDTETCTLDACQGVGQGTFECTDDVPGPGFVATCCDLPQAFSTMADESEGHRLVLDATHAYWTENSTTEAWLFRKAFSAGTREELANASAIANGSLDAYGVLAVTSSQVVWFDALNERIATVALDGGVVETLASDVTVAQLAADSSHIYFTGSDDSSSGPRVGVFRVEAAGGEVEHFASSSGAAAPLDLALDGTHVYWVEHNGSTGGVYRREK
jgi:hypothetical protein